ncbi:hypothetical protein LOAG_15542 [Loa loa]|uniref:Uncharacterized protein n=1 Tax=Loa loa TaxID=7209 RepID=A0A1S0TFG4_LOALO|nr:hypothetical protein LOAG_15542 [Loa loa]EFO12989.2 hypothetical protein LOAG_15542 [Loa loa]
MITIDSSLDSSSDTIYNEPLSKVPVRKRSALLLQSSFTKNNRKFCWRMVDKKRKNFHIGLASPTISQHSFEFNDLFEFYSEDNKRGQRNSKFKKRRNLLSSLKVSSAVDIKKNFPNAMLKHRRKDLEFDEFIQRKDFNLSENSDRQIKVRGKDEIRSSEPKITLVLEMKLKISDKQVRCSAHSRIGEETVVVTCAGDYGDMESILKWTIDRKVEDGQELWVNDPVVDTSNWDNRRLQMISDVTFRP